MIALAPLIPSPESLKFLWERFNEHRSAFGDELPADPIDFVCWLSARDARGFLVGEPPIGLFLFTNIDPGVSAFSHVFVWEREAVPHAEIIEAAQLACAAMFKALDLKRLNGLTPVTNLPARVFAERVGFKIEGRARRAVSMGGFWTDAWISGLLPEDLEAAMASQPPERATLEVKESS